MTRKDFLEFHTGVCEEARNIVIGKGREYQDDEDILSGIYATAKKFNITPRKVVSIYLEKHLIAIGNEIRLEKDSVESSRYVDAINYLMFLLALRDEEAVAMYEAYDSLVEKQAQQDKVFDSIIIPVQFPKGHSREFTISFDGAPAKIYSVQYEGDKLRVFTKNPDGSNLQEGTEVTDAQDNAILDRLTKTAFNVSEKLVDEF